MKTYDLDSANLSPRASVLPRNHFLIACLFIFCMPLFIFIPFFIFLFCFMLHILSCHIELFAGFVVGLWSLRIWNIGLCDGLFIFVILFKLDYVIFRLCDW